MLRLCLIILSVAVKFSNGEQGSGTIGIDEIPEDNLVSTTPSGIESSEMDLETVIKAIEKAALFVDKSYLEDAQPKEEVEKLYEEMAEILDEIIELLNNPIYVSKFLKAGLDRVIESSIDITYPKLRTQLLTLLKNLFEVDPVTTNAVIPSNVIDKLLDIFETDNTLDMKSLVIDVLSKWLPGNPKIQARVMRVKGLEPFYHQMSKLNTTVISNLLHLFRMILNEHIKVRNNKKIRSEIDSDTLLIYQRIGFIEHLSTHNVCNGLIDIFKATTTTNDKFLTSKDNNILIAVFDLVVKIKPYCLKNYKGKVKVMDYFATLLNYVKDKNNIEYLEKLNMNVTNIEEVLTDYVENLKKSIKYEL